MKSVKEVINWDCTDKDMNLIKKIVDKAFNFGYEGDRIDLTMDITATHCNGTALDLHKLLKADRFNFLHDVYGIRQHIDRNTGKMKDFFIPRCTK